MNPLKLAHEVHDLARSINLLACADANHWYVIRELTIQIDLRLHEIIGDYERRGMEYDGPSS